VAGCGFTATTWANRRIHFLRKHCKNEISTIRDENNVCKGCKKHFNSSTAFIYHAGGCINGTQIAYFQGIV
jgi:hypothetical protein